MMEFEFTLKFTLTTDRPGVDELVEHLGAAGCDDALVGIGQSGRIALDFTREADSAKEAIFSALADVKRAIPVAKLLEVTPDFVGLTDIAELVGVSRQNMRKLALAHKESFPAAVHEGSATLWHLSPVLKWLGESANYSIKRSLLDVAHIAMQINLAKEASQIERQVQRELLELVA
jgi:hypothetical protein